MADQSHIPEACAILTSLRHCQQQAVEYRRCVDEKGGDRDCGWQHQAFVSCAEDSLEKVVKELTVVASDKCKEEVAAHHRCLEANGSTSAACVGTDEAALNCAAKHVVAAANQMALARSSGD